jgi:hypothetical protein
VETLNLSPEPVDALPIATAADIDFEFKAGPWPTSAGTSFDDPFERLIDLSIERDSYRDLLQQTLHALHCVTVDRDVLREQRRIDRQQRRCAKCREAI